MTIEPLSAWDSFWKYDRLSSFQSGPGAGNYGVPIADGWHGFFDSLPDGARILDLATGNGAIAVMAVESANAAGKNFAVTGANLADVRPTAYVTRNLAELEQIHFLTATPAEQLPLEPDSLDAVVSQYGLEYSDLDRSLPEAVRVLGPGGRLRLAMHAADGTVARDTVKAIADADFLIHVEIIPLARRCFDADGTASGPAALAAMNAALKAIAIRVPTATDQAMLANVHRALCDAHDGRRGKPLADLLATADHLGAEIAAHRGRQSALLAAAQSIKAMHRLGERLAALGMTGIGHGEQRDGGDLIGHVIEAQMP